MPVVIADQEHELNIHVIDLEKEVFDLDSYSYNQVVSNVDTNFQLSQLALPVMKI